MKCNCKSVISEILDAGRALHNKRVELEGVLNCEIEVFDFVHDYLSNAITYLVNLDKHDHEEEELFTVVFDYCFGYEHDKELTIEKILEIGKCCKQEG